MASSVDAAQHKLMVEMALPCVIHPILRELEENSSASSPTLIKEAFDTVENFYPGFTEFFISRVLLKAQVEHRVDMAEAILKLEGSGKQRDVKLRRTEPAFKNLQHRADSLKLILGRIPAEIADRKKFLDTIKDIAQAIKHLLDSVNDSFTQLSVIEDRNRLDKKKRDFVKYSKRFSTTLKDFFKDNRRSAVYLSANHLVHQTNQILLAVG
ncbi:programmed cell death protein 10-like isoform X2 [Watersipora subatra]|uniref:programmed cell death protein 10-like isoform X2 n=1 Tax=Watersipora subatra TaxID=2589382 RepID=UPI00355C4DA9